MSGPPPPTAGRREIGRREIGIAVSACLVGATLTLVAIGQPWVQVTVAQPAPLPSSHLAMSGRLLAPLAAAGGGVGLAGVVAIIAARRWSRVVIGVLLVLAGAAVVASFPSTGTDAVRRSVSLAERVPNIAISGSTATVVRTGWSLAATTGGVLMAGAGALTVVRGRHWPVMGDRYDAPAGPKPVVPAASETAQWDALDRGEDPTA